MSAIFVSQPITVYEVDFLILDLWFLDGFKTGNHIGFCLVVVFWLFPSQKMGCSTQILFNHQISCFKAMPSFYGQKNDLLKWLFFGSFLVVSHWFFGVQFPIFLFLGLWLLNFFRMLLTFFLEMFYKKHNIFFVGRGKKGSLDFLKKQFYF